jgi:hypothetical protein
MAHWNFAVLGRQTGLVGKSGPEFAQNWSVAMIPGEAEAEAILNFGECFARHQCALSFRQVCELPLFR